jgi:hypothetical protein
MDIVWHEISTGQMLKGHGLRLRSKCYPGILNVEIGRQTSP